jgi:phosphate starvation-inducible PhoH-like protein
MNIKSILKTTTICFMTCVTSRKANTASLSNKAFHKKMYVIDIQPKSDLQRDYLTYLNDNVTKVIFALGYAGTGKTFIACQYALNAISLNKCCKLIMTKPLVTVSDEAIGFLPGSLKKKLEPWMQNMLYCMKSGVPDAVLKELIASEQIEFTPLGFMRGSTIENSIVIADEMQNSSPAQLKMLLTRIGKNTTLIITGDINQKDIRCISGIEDFLKRYQHRSLDAIKILHFGIDEIQRESFLKDVLKLYETEQFPHGLSVIQQTKKNLNETGFRDAAMIPL